MTGRLKDIWRAPYPAVIASWKTVTVPAAIVFLILYLLEPFGLSQKESGLLWVSLGAALISAGVSSVFVWVLPPVFPRWYAEQGWTLGKEVVNTLALLLSIAVCVWLYVAWLTGMVLSFRLFFIVLLWVLILGAFPTVLFALWNRNIQFAGQAGSREAFFRSSCLSGRHPRDAGDGRHVLSLRGIRGQLHPPVLPLSTRPKTNFQTPAPYDEASRGVGFCSLYCPVPPGLPGQSASRD